MQWTKDKPTISGHYWVAWKGWCPRLYEIHSDWGIPWLTLNSGTIFLSEMPTTTIYYGPLEAPKVPDELDKE